MISSSDFAACGIEIIWKNGISSRRLPLNCSCALQPGRSPGSTYRRILAKVAGIE